MPPAPRIQIISRKSTYPYCGVRAAAVEDAYTAVLSYLTKRGNSEMGERKVAEQTLKWVGGSNRANPEMVERKVAEQTLKWLKGK